MRYLLNTKTNETVTVADDDDKRFYELLAERDDDDRQLYVQTGPQDTAVDDAVVVPGQERGPSRMERAGLTGDEGEATPGSTLRERQIEAQARGKAELDVATEKAKSEIAGDSDASSSGGGSPPPASPPASPPSPPASSGSSGSSGAGLSERGPA